MYKCNNFYLIGPSSNDSEQLAAVEVTVRSDIPIGAGLGSSAAFSVSLAGNFFGHVFWGTASTFLENYRRPMTRSLSLNIRLFHYEINSHFRNKLS